MNKAGPTNMVASVRQRLLSLSRARGEDFNLVLTWYTIERLLYRLTRSSYANRFALKGALLFALWTGKMHRPTRDLDLLGHGDSSAQGLARLFRDVCSIDVQPDGLTFDPEQVSVTEIREAQEYGGKRVRLVAMLGKARIPVQVDIGFGDAVTPQAAEVDYPTLLDFPAPRLRAYPKETVVAEKLHAMVVLGMLNSRMRDFYDLWLMSKILEFDGTILVRAIQATFERRRTKLPYATPIALTAEFAYDADKATQWRAFLTRNRLDTGGVTFAEVIGQLHNFLMPVLLAAANDSGWSGTWANGGSWVS